MSELDDNDEHGVGFLFKAMRERDPKKRRVKPVEAHLLQLDFGGLGDSSDDSDYEVAASQEDNSEPDSDRESSGSSDGSEETSRSETEDNDANGRSDDESITLGDLLSNIKNDSPKAEDFSLSRVSSSAKLKVRICSVCLGDYSEEDDEIVECDCCGITVHEGCYGVSENQSVGSTVSSASTEPWFCDACKAGVKPHCELCPNFGGIYKETDAGKWVHVVCALYIPGVAFGDVDLLSPVTLLEMPYSKWGAKECGLCEDARFSRTGVSIGCDAGMCRNYFHVSCAQREGLLSEASPDEEIADPFFAYCKQHAEKNAARMKRRNFLAVQSNCKRPGDLPGTSNIDDKEKARVERKLKGHRQKYHLTRTNRTPTWVPTEKLPRLLTTSPSAMRSLLRKAELLGISSQASTSQKTDIRKKWHVAPAFTVDYISYYLDRNVRIKNGTAHLKEHLQQNNKLGKQEKVLRAKYDQLAVDIEKDNRRNNQLRTEAEKLWGILGKINGKPFPMPKILRPKKVVKKKHKDTPKSPPAVIHSCGICSRSNDQHLLAHCDTCKKYYHLGCVDPPLTRMPKKTKQMGWQCSECDSSESDDSDTNDGVDTNAPRKLRESHQIKLPAKFTPPPKESRKEGGVAKDRKGKRKRKKSKKLLQAEGDEEEKEMPILKKEKPLKVRDTKSPKPRDVRTQCCVCLQPGDNNNLVRCDECKLCYHFGCLDPPMKKSPKQRGYAWHCTACDPTESDINDEGEDGADDGEDEGESLEMDEEEDPLEPPKLEKVARQSDATKSNKETTSRSKPLVQPEANLAKSATESAAEDSASPVRVTPSTASVKTVKDTPTGTVKKTPSPNKRKTPTKKKCERKEKPLVPQSPSLFPCDATVLHVSQDTTNCSPIPVLKPIAASTPDLCYSGTEDIVPKVGIKPMKTKKKSCSKKENKGTTNPKSAGDCLKLPAKKKSKAGGKSDFVNGSIDVSAENSVLSEKPAKKKKKAKNTKNDVIVKTEIDSSPHNVNKNDQLLEKVKLEPLEIDNTDITAEKKKKKKRSAKDDDGPNAKKKQKVVKQKVVKQKKLIDAQKLSNTKKKKKVKVERPDTSTDFNKSLENQDENSVDMPVSLINKKETIGSLALQATVAKLQGRLTPTLSNGNGVTNGGTGSSHTGTLQAMPPTPSTSKDVNDGKVSGAEAKSPQQNFQTEKITTTEHDKNPSADSSPLHVNVDNYKETKSPADSTVSNYVNVPEKEIHFSPQKNVLDLSNKGDKFKTIVSKDGSLDLSMKNTLPDTSVHQAQTENNSLVNNSEKRTPENNMPGAVNEVKDTNGQNEGNAPKVQNLSTALKKERVESAIERLFQKRDYGASGSPVVKKQRVEKTIDMLLAKKEMSTESEKSVADNIHQTSIKDTDNAKDNRS